MRRVLALSALALALSCASPTLPLPPPAVPTVTSAQNGMVHLVSRGGAEPNAIIIILNHDPAVPLDKRVSGSQADGNGTWDADVVATTGDVLEITQEFGSTRSPPITLQVP